MIKRGRKSEASILSPQARILTTNTRLAAPSHLTDAEMSVWTEVVNDQPATSFTATHSPLLEMYCRHIVQGRILADEILNFDRSWLADDDGLKRYDRLLGMAERETRAASSLATRMRITRQALHPETATNEVARHVKSKKPWEMAEMADND
jgi:hypothetical protein